MRILFAPFSTTPHVFTVIPLAWALHTAGHDVRVAVHPDACEQVTDAGLIAVGVGADLNIRSAIDSAPGDELLDTLDDSCGLALTTDSLIEHRLRMRILGTLSMYFCDEFPSGRHDAMVRELVAFARQWRPDLVIWDPLNVQGAVAARACGAAHARMLFASDHVARMRTAFTARPRASADDGPDLVAAFLEPVLREYGCGFDEEVLLGQWTIDPHPPWMRLPVDVTTVPVRKIPYNGVSVIPRWLREPRRLPRVCLSMGVSQREVWHRDTVLLSGILDALGRFDVEVVATLSETQRAAVTVPNNVRVVDYVPLHALLPECSAVIHHGGPGTYANAAAQGVPQLVVPLQLWDEERVADLVSERGAGLSIHPDELDADAVHEAMERLLNDPAFTSTAAQVRTDVLAMPSPNAIVPVLERLTADHAPRSVAQT